MVLSLHQHGASLPFYRKALSLMATEVTKSEPMLTNDEDLMGSIKSFSDAMAVLADANVGVVDFSDEFGDGFSTIEDKGTLVGVPFVILGIKFAEGDYGDNFAICHIVTEDGRKIVLVDGGTGIRKQAESITKKGISGGVLVKKGLTRSDYEYINEAGKRTPATTFYFAQ